MDPRSSLTETKSSRKESSFPAEMSLIKLLGTATLQLENFCLVPQEHLIRMRSDECDKQQKTHNYFLKERNLFNFEMFSI